MSSGGDVSKFNLTSLALAPIIGSGWKEQAFKNVLSSFGEINAAQGYNGIQLTAQSFYDKTMQAGIGFGIDRTLSSLQTNPNFNNTLYTRLRNLSYKPKFETQYTQFLKRYTTRLNTSLITNSGAVGVISTAGSNLASNAVEKN